MTGELGASVSGSLNHTAPTTNKKESPPHQKSYACDRIVIHMSTNHCILKLMKNNRESLQMWPVSKTEELFLIIIIIIIVICYSQILISHLFVNMF